MPIKIDLNDEGFQRDLFDLEKIDAWAFMKTMRKLVQLEWDDLYRDSGLNWEAIGSRRGKAGARVFTIRITQKCRAVVERRGDIMMFLELHPDHDGAY